MSKREKWVVFPEGQAGLHRVALADGRTGFVLSLAPTEAGYAVREAATDLGFLVVPGVADSLHFVPVEGAKIPFTLPQLAKALGGKITDFSASEMRTRTFGVIPEPETEAAPEPVIPVRPTRIALNASGEAVLQAENGRFVRIEQGDREIFIQEPATGSRARFLRAVSEADLAPIAGAIFKNVNESFSGARMEQIIRAAMEPRTPDEAPEFTFDQARAFVRDDLIKQVMESAVSNDASRGAWHDTARIATWMNSAVAEDTRPGESLTPSLHLMMLVHRLSRKHNSVDFLGSNDMSLAVPGRREEKAALAVLDLSGIPDGQRLSYAINRVTRRQDAGRTILILPTAPDSDEAETMRNNLGTIYGVESVLSMPHTIADGTAGYTEWTMMVLGDKRPEPLDALPVAALRTMKAVTPEDLLSFEREVNRSVERLREFNSGEELELEKADKEEVKSNDHQVPYIAMSKVSEPETMIPYALQGAVGIAQGKVIRHMEEKGGVDAAVSSALGISIGDMGSMISAEQVDSVAFWLYSRDREMKGFACLDGTGVGKTRSNLGIARAFLRLDPHEGKKRKIFYLTENNLNAPDVVKELHEMGMGDLRVGVLTSPFKNDIKVRDLNGKEKQITVAALSKREKDEIFASEAMPDEFDIIISTFSTFKSAAADNPASVWAHTAFDPSVMIIADEAHNAINVKSNTGRNIRAMRLAVPDNQFLSSTATPFKTPEEVMAYDYLLPASAGDPEEIMNAVVRGKEAAQEAFTTMLAQDGSMIRRTRSLSSVNFRAHLPDDEQLRHNQGVMSAFADLSTRMSEESASITNRIRQIIQDETARLRVGGMNEEEALRVAREQNRDSERFGTALSRLTNMVLVGLRVQGIYPQIKQDMESGVKPVISFEHTMMGLFEEKGEDEDITNLTMRDQIRRVQERIYKVHVNGQDTDIRTLDAQIAASATAISDAINRFPELPASPIDWLMDQLENDGVTCGELSGRTLRYSNGQLVKRTSKDRDKRSTVDKFNSGELDVLFHNKTGATGVSFHAHKDFLDQRPRSTYIVAAFSEVIKMLQGFGRTDRKEQTSNPTINWVMTGLIGETRSFQQINRRLRMLGASVDANRNHPMLIADVPDLLNKVGDRAFLNVLRNRPDVAQRMDVAEYLQAGNENRVVDDREDAISATSIMNLANTCMARMVMLRDEEQNQLMDSVQLEFDALIEELDARNANPLKPKRVDGEIVITSQVVYQGEEAIDGDYDRSAFLDPLYLCTGVQRIEGRTMTGDDVVARVERCRRLQGADGLETWANIVRTAMPNYLRRNLPDGITYEAAAENPTVGGPMFQKRFELLDRMVRTMEQIKPGVTVRMPMIDDLWETPNSYVVTDIVPPPNMLEAGNAAGYKLKMIAPGEITERTVTLKRIMDLKEEEVVFHIGLSRGDNRDLRRSFDESSADVYERPVQILNGNLLKAIVTSINHNLGTPCLYKDANSGQLMKGIVITDRKLDLKRLPVDLRDKEAAEVLLDRRRQGNAKTTLLQLYAAPSNVKNEYSSKDPAFFITGTEATFIMGVTFNRGTYPFFRDRPEMYQALFNRPLPELRQVRASRSVMPVRIRYTDHNADARIATIMEGAFRRIEDDSAINLNFFVSGTLRDEVNEILRTRANPFGTAPVAAIEEAQVVDVVSPKAQDVPQAPVTPVTGVSEIEGEEDISWEV